MTISRALAPAMLLAGTLAFAGEAEAQRRPERPERERVDTTFGFERSGTITVTGGSGSIVVDTWSNNQVRVRARSDAGVRFDASRTHVVLETERWGGSGRYEVTVPEGVKVIARTHSGSIEVRGTKGPVQAQTQSGNIRLAEAQRRIEATSLSGDVHIVRSAGDVDVTTVSGDVWVSETDGRISVGTVSGDVELRQASSPSVRVKTTSGDVVYEGVVSPAGQYELGSHSGDVRLVIPAAASARISVSTWSGGIESPDFPITLSPGEHGIGTSSTKRFTFTVGGGEARVIAESFSGDIIITSSARRAGRR